MPNHCHNFMSVEGTEEDIQEFLKAVTFTDENGEEVISIARGVLPMPTALVGTQSPNPDSPEPNANWATLLANGEITQEWHDELVRKNRERYEKNQKALAETGYTDWYSWCHDNWGTKWGDYGHDQLDLDDNGKSLSVIYETAWCPFSDKFFSAFAKRFPKLTVENRYEELGMDFCGLILVKGGELVYSGYAENLSADIQPEASAEIGDDDYEEYWDKQRTAYDQAFEQFESEAYEEV